MYKSIKKIGEKESIASKRKKKNPLVSLQRLQKQLSNYLKILTDETPNYRYMHTKYEQDTGTVSLIYCNIMPLSDQML